MTDQEKRQKNKNKTASIEFAKMVSELANYGYNQKMIGEEIGATTSIMHNIHVGITAASAKRVAALRQFFDEVKAEKNIQSDEIDWKEIAIMAKDAFALQKKEIENLIAEKEKLREQIKEIKKEY